MRSKNAKALPRKQREAGEFDNFVPKSRAYVGDGWVKRFGTVSALLKRPVEPKTPGRNVKAIRESARGEECLMMLPGCKGGTEHTIWSHNRHWFAGKGRGIKAIDVNGCYACTHCDGIYDGQIARPFWCAPEAVELAWYHAHARSLVKLAQKGLI